MWGFFEPMKIVRTDRMANPSIQLTDVAAARVRHLVSESGNAQLKLRARVDGCGCEGFQYRFLLDDAVRDGDVILAQDDGVAIVVDPASYPHLKGSEIDCLQGSLGADFIVRNPNEEVGCDC